MKAILRDVVMSYGKVVAKSGERVTLMNNTQNINTFTIILKNGTIASVKVDDICIIDGGVDWEQRRYEIAKETYNALLIAIEPADYDIEKEDLISDSILLADEFIEKLKNN